MTNTENTQILKAELLRRAAWLSARSETVLDISEAYTREGDAQSAQEYSDQSQSYYLGARELRRQAAAL